MSFYRRRNEDAEVQQEMESYLAEEIAENRARGMSAEEAERRARVKMGSAQKVRENLWQQNSFSAEKLWRDVKYAVRTLWRSPGFSLIAIVVMALCIGAATSLFTIVRSVLLKPLPFRDPGSLVMVYEHWRSADANRDGFNYNVVSPADFFDWRAQTHGFEDMAVWHWYGFNLTGEHGELPEVVRGVAGSWNLFPLLGVEPAVGRTFTQAEDHPGSDVVMLTWSAFQRRFAGNASIVGHSIHLDGKPYTVVGVLPASFTYPDARVQVWVPYAAPTSPEWLKFHDHHQSYVIARLKPGVSLENAISQVSAVQYQEHLQNLHAPVAEDVAPRNMIDDLARDVKKPLIILMCAVVCMLLIGCLNVANLLVARSAARQKEVAVRTALGAQRFTLVREQMMESLLICLAGGVAGVLLSFSATRWLASSWKELPSSQGIHVDGAVMAFACGLVAVAALAAGMLPALSSTGASVMVALQASSRTAGGSRTRTALRKGLLTVEIAVTVVLLVGAGLLLKSFLRLQSTNLGCDTSNLLTLGYSLDNKKYDSHAKVNAFNEALLARLRAMPGVRGVALGSTLPGDGYSGDDVFTVSEHPPLPAGVDLPDAIYRKADPEYFKTLGIPLLKGRYFTEQDRDQTPYRIIISSQLARQYFPGEDPIGKHLRIPAVDDKNTFEIIGVVGDTLYLVGKPSKAMFYFPILSGKTDDGFALAVRTDSNPLGMSIPVQKQIAALDPELPVSDVMTLDQVIGESLLSASFSATIVLAFAVLSLVLACVGLYGVLSYLMTLRMTELGIRIALGAQRQELLRLMLFDGMRPAFLGLGFGLLAGAAATQAIASMLYGTRPLDPAVFAVVTGALLGVSMLACLVPAWRASRLDPMQALRTE
ncbi:ABC transporter permease [Acidobacteria bacterium AB60]|nr:ABC transporter permease [Acidobacteria bacterium AB60]